MGKLGMFSVDWPDGSTAYSSLHTAKEKMLCDYCGRTIRTGGKYRKPHLGSEGMKQLWGRPTHESCVVEQMSEFYAT